MKEKSRLSSYPNRIKALATSEALKCTHHFEKARTEQWNSNDKDSNESPNEKATQAYKLFSEGKKLVDISIELDLMENEASKYFHEFLRLKGQDELYEIYLENKHYLRTLRMLHRVLKREGVAAAVDKIDWFVNMVKLGTYKIPELQNEYAKLKDEVEAIDYKKTMAKHALEDMNNQITILRRTISQLSATYIKKSGK